MDVDGCGWIWEDVGWMWMDMETRKGRSYWVGGVTRGGPGAPPVWGFSADLFKKRPKFCKNVEIASK